jgi:tripartite-type tricarboxylate transporter receptor subunit TctC
LLKNKQVNLLLQTGIQRNSDLPNLPRMVDLANNGNDRELLALFSSQSTIGRSLAAPPDVPVDRVAAVRKAFTSAMSDSAFLDEVRKLKLELDPLDGAKLQAEVMKSGSVSPELIARARRVAEK